MAESIKIELLAIAGAALAARSLCRKGIRRSVAGLSARYCDPNHTFVRADMIV
jgi:hypothetical protein